MSKFNISGIQQVGVGTESFRSTFNWVIKYFGADVKILEDDTVAERMLPYTGGKPQKRHACITVSLQGGGGFEVWQYSERKPVPCPFEIKAGDLGIFAAKVRCRDVDAYYNKYSKELECSRPSLLPDGTRCMYVKDLYGNAFQLVEVKEIFIDEGVITGGIYGALVGVTDMEASIKFYSEILGYDHIIVDKSGTFDDLHFLPGGDQNYRRVIIGTSSPRHGAFAGLFGDSTIELVQALDRTPAKIYEGRYWGDPGFIQICFDVSGMKALGEFCASKGHPFTVDSCPGDIEFDMGDASGHFTYIEDPDGTLIEFVETHKIPIVKKLGWFLDMKKRDPKKSLPKFLFRMIGLVSREKIK